MIFTTPTKKEAIVKALVEAFFKVSKEFSENQDDLVIRGKYLMILELMGTVKIYGKEE